MLENLKALLPSQTTYKDGPAKARAAGLVEKFAAELKAAGLDPGSTADTATSSTVGVALSLLRVQVAAASFPSAYAKGWALGLVDQLRAELSSTGLNVIT